MLDMFPEKYRESAGTFGEEQHNYMQSKRQRQRFNIPGKGLEVPCMWLASYWQPSQVEKLIRIFQKLPQ